MRVAFRVDASKVIGTGHFMRCFTLASELKNNGSDVCFISRNLPSHFMALLSEAGIRYAPMKIGVSEDLHDGLNYSQWLGMSQASDAKETIHHLSGDSWDWLVVDHYALDERWEMLVHEHCKKIMVIDDLADRHHYCDLLLDQNYYSDMQIRYGEKVPVNCRMLLGPQYALLREDFTKLHKQIDYRDGVVKNVLVFFGGIDSGNYTGHAIQALSNLKIELTVNVVIGLQHPFREFIQNACNEMGYSCFVESKHMAQLMAEADLSIGAGGSATWERCCLGLPAICLSLAENQEKQVKDAAEVGVLCAPVSNDNAVDVIMNHVKCMIENPGLLRLLSKTGMEVVDGMGSIRVATAMTLCTIKIRQADENDSKNIFEWRNHPKVRAASKNSDYISWETHQNWFRSAIGDSNRILLMGCIDDKPLGFVRFDVDGDSAEVSIYLVPDGGFVGQGSNLLFIAEQWLQENRPEVRKISANVLSENQSSKKLFLKSKYQEKLILYQKIL